MNIGFDPVGMFFCVGLPDRRSAVFVAGWADGVDQFGEKGFGRFIHKSSFNFESNFSNHWKNKQASRHLAPSFGLSVSRKTF
jgi:hypothetical protein